MPLSPSSSQTIWKRQKEPIYCQQRLNVPSVCESGRNRKDGIKYVWEYQVPGLVTSQRSKREKLGLNIHVKLLPCKPYKLSSIK